MDGTDNSIALLPSAFENSLSLGAEVEFGDQDDFMDRAQGSSTPIAATRTGHHGDGKSEERAVLRIDNVPWVSLFPSNLGCTTVDNDLR